MAQQCAVAGHIAGMIQERSNTAANAAIEDHQTAAADHPVCAEEALSSPLKPVRTLNTVERRCVQVPVDIS